MRPTLVISIGGIGAWAVGKTVRKLAAAAEHRAGEEGREALADSLRFLLVDTDEPDSYRELVDEFPDLVKLEIFGPYFNVKKRLERHLADDPWLRNWWPAKYTNIDDIKDGVGHIRLKGKLAYYLALREQGVNSFVNRVISQLAQIAPPEAGHQTVDIYFVCSLSGGTGSGLLLTLAQQLKQDIQFPAPKIYALYLDASALVSEATNQGRAKLEASNCWTTLNEIDFWSGPQAGDLKEFHPFWQIGDYEIAGRDSPFVTLFGIQKGGMAGTLRNKAECVNMLSDCLALRLRPRIQDEIVAREVDVEQAVADEQDVREQSSIRFGSMGVASLRFPVEAVTTYLARRYASSIMDHYFIHPTGEYTNKASDAASTFAKDLKIVQGEEGEERLTKALGEEIELPGETEYSFPDAAAYVLDSYKKVGVAQAAEDYIKALNNHLTYLEKLCQANKARLMEEVDEKIPVKVKSLLTSGTPEALVFAHHFFEGLKMHLENEHRRLKEELERDAEGDQGPGLALTQKNEQKEFKALIETVQTELRKKAFLRDEDKVKVTLGAQGVALRNAIRDTFMTSRAVDVVNHALQKVDTQMQIFDMVQDSLQSVRHSLLHEGDQIDRSSGIKETLILPDESAHLTRWFPEPMISSKDASQSATSRGCATLVLDLGDRTVPWVWALFSRFLGERAGASQEEDSAPLDHQLKFHDALLRNCKRAFIQDVSSMSLWEAYFKSEQSKTGTVDNTKIVASLGDLVQGAAAAARPYWQLDSTAGQGNQLAMVFYDKKAAVASEKILPNLTHQIDEGLKAGFSNVTAFEEQDLEGTPSELICYYMQQGIPLRDFNEVWRGDLYGEFKSLMEEHPRRDRRLWSDVRYSDESLPSILPLEAQAEFKYVIGLALHESILDFNEEGELYYKGHGIIEKFNPLESLGSLDKLEEVIARIPRIPGLYAQIESEIEAKQRELLRTSADNATSWLREAMTDMQQQAVDCDAEYLKKIFNDLASAIAATVKRIEGEHSS